MSEKVQGKSERPSRRKSTVIYGKLFALIGVMAGLALVAVTPVIVTFFHDENQTWVESLPEWTVPAMLLTGMGGGVLITFLSVLFAMLIPSRIEPRDD